MKYYRAGKLCECACVERVKNSPHLFLLSRVLHVVTVPTCKWLYSPSYVGQKFTFWTQCVCVCELTCVCFMIASLFAYSTSCLVIVYSTVCLVCVCRCVCVCGWCIAIEKFMSDPLHDWESGPSKLGRCLHRSSIWLDVVPIPALSFASTDLIVHRHNFLLTDHWHFARPTNSRRADDIL